MRLLVTGASGFSGHHLVRYLASLEEGRPEVFGVIRSVPPATDDAEVSWVTADLTDPGQSARAVRGVEPDAVIHLAGLNRGCLRDLLEVNVLGTENVLDAVAREAPSARVLVVGSSAEYGYAGHAPVPEENPLRPVTPYGLSKAAQGLLALRYHAVRHLSVAVAVPFNLIGPGLPESFVAGRIVRQAQEIAGGRRSAMELVGLESRRDFVDVRDAAAAYWRLLAADGFEERIAGNRFNIGSGTARSIAEVVDLVRRLTGVGFDVRLQGMSEPDPVPAQAADTTRIRAAIGWFPELALDQSLRDMLAWTRPE